MVAQRKSYKTFKKLIVTLTFAIMTAKIIGVLLIRHTTNEQNLKALRKKNCSSYRSAKKL